MAGQGLQDLPKSPHVAVGQCSPLITNDVAICEGHWLEARIQATREWRKVGRETIQAMVQGAFEVGAMEENWLHLSQGALAGIGRLLVVGSYKANAKQIQSVAMLHSRHVSAASMLDCCPA